jgi:hypothetical protein
VSCLQACDIPVAILESGKLGRTVYLCQILLHTGGKMTHRNFKKFSKYLMENSQWVNTNFLALFQDFKCLGSPSTSKTGENLD